MKKIVFFTLLATFFSTQILEIVLIDALGKRVWHQAQSKFAGGNHRVEIGNINQNLSQGTYIIRVVGGKLLGTTPLIITNK